MKQQLKIYKTKVEQELTRFFDKKIKETHGFNKEILKHLKEFTLRGKSKRIRPFLINLGYQAFGGKEQKKIIKASTFIELIHAFLLIHDDVIDQDEYRRGKPTFHKIFEKGRSQHFGESVAIIAGDIAYTLGLETIFNLKLSSDIKLRVLKKINQMILDTGQGEALDVWLTKNNINSQKDILEVYKYKTAKYTFEAPLHIGALLAGAGQKDLKKLSDYAIPLGIAFQIQDDVLGAFGDQEKIGKPVGSDIKEGKQTLLTYQAFKKSNLLQKKKLSRLLLSKQKITRKEINEVRKIMIETGALEYSRGYAKKLALKAKSQIKLQKINPKTKITLLQIADYIISRNY